MIKIDGNYLEGGGQIVRTSLALSALVQKGFEVSDIRKGRKDPGLKSQHLHGIKALQQLCNPEVEGAEIGSLNIKFLPRKLTSKNLDIDIGTAGSATLLMQSLFLPCIFASKPMTITITGGTDVSWSPSFDYMANVLVPHLQRFAKVEAKLLKRGYYPKGSGKIEIRINQKFKFNSFESFSEFQKNLNENVRQIELTEQHHLIQIKGISHASSDLENTRVSERQAHSAQEILAKKYNVPIKISSEYQNTLSTGSGITLWAIFSKNKEDIDEFNPIRIGCDRLGEKGIKAELIGEETANSLIAEIESKAPADSHLADQILPFMALLPGSSIKTSKITSHAMTNIYAIEQFLGSIFKTDEKTGIISANRQ
ncbi:MAG TPA: RNA 3'-terminal phosphate cyclase [Candidatus Nanoarchaeia archaeon]|nr:RNA 3'-terminal phosphate cyclase [Candidatus Nanoarchaeia archaeon]